jgi:hypothetical protein
MSNFGERISKASAGLRGVYGRPKLPGGRPKVPGVFSTNALQMAKQKDGPNSKAHQNQIHKTRASMVIGNILTLGTVNLYYLLRGAGDIKKAEAAAALDNTITNMSIAMGTEFALNADKLKHQIKYELGLVDAPPTFDDKKEEAVFYTVYELNRSRGKFPGDLVKMFDGQ